MNYKDFPGSREELEAARSAAVADLQFTPDPDGPRILDSGARRRFDSGAVRDVAAGKGRCDLLPLSVVAGLTEKGRVFSALDGFVRFRHKGPVLDVIRAFIFERWTDIPTGLLEVALHFEEGAAKYEERNWETGIPLHCFVDSAIRHYLKYRRGDTDEPHDRAFVWNLLCLLWTYENRPEMDDLPPVVNPE